MTRLTEGPIEDYLLAQCRQAGFLCWKFVSPSRGGVPDRIVITPSGTVFVELKRPGGDLEPRQRAIHKKMRAKGARIFILDGYADIDAFVLEQRAASGTQPSTTKETPTHGTSKRT